VSKSFFGFVFGLSAQGDGGADEVFEGFRVKLVAFVNVDGAAGVSFEAGVEETGRVFYGCAFGKGDLYGGLVSFESADDAGVREDGDATGVGGFGPLPLFDDFRVGLLDEGADAGDCLAAPVVDLLSSLILSSRAADVFEEAAVFICSS